MLGRFAAFAVAGTVAATTVGGSASLAADLSPPARLENPNIDTTGNEYTGLPVGAWTVSPQVFFGGVFDSNPNQSPANGPSSAGARLVPSFTAHTGDGIHDANVYGLLDGRFYANSIPNQTVVTGRTGGTYVYSPLPDLSFNITGDYTRDRDFLNASTGLGNVNNPPPPNPFGILTLSNPTIFNQFSGSAAVLKTFDRAFASLTGKAAALIYDTVPAGTVNPDGNRYAVEGRLGFWATPIINVFADSTLDWRQYRTSAFDSNGYRVVAGLGTAQIGLMQGEVYGGYEQERPTGSINAPPHSSSGVLGGKLNYSPTPFLTLFGSIDQTLGVSTAVTAPGSLLGTSTRGTTGLLTARYAMVEYWSASVRAGFLHTEYLGTAFHDDGWLVGTAWSYFFWRNMALTADYQFSHVNSNVPGNPFNRHLVTAGLTWRY